MQNIKVDICCGLSWGDEAKGKIVAYLAREKKYDFVCRWAGGHNAGHTIYKEGKKYKTHLIPSGIFSDILSVIGPDCVVEKNAFLSELAYLKENGFNTELIKISPKCHVISETHLTEDKQKYVKSQGSTSKGIAPCYRDKYARIGKRVDDPENIDFFRPFLWDEKLHGNVLCEGAQGFWLDINNGNYPYVTSSNTLPYGACSLGFPPQCINTIYGASKIYDTRSGIDTDFPDTLFDDVELNKIGECGHEYGVTTGRKRKVNWLNMDKLITSIQLSGTHICVISKIDILEKVGLFKLYHNNELLQFENMEEMKTYISDGLIKNCLYLKNVIYSDNVENINL